MKVLVTGFAPFGGDGFNPSQAAVEALEAPDGITLYKAILPVTWENAFPTLLSAFEAAVPDAVLMTGLAGGRSGISVERVGLNLCGALRDAEGKYPTGDEGAERRIIEDAPDAYFSTYDHTKILTALKDGGFAAGLSYSAGTYLCNYILFSVLHLAKTKGMPLRAGFLHLPYASEMKKDAPSLPLAKLTEAIGIALSNL